MANKMTFSVTRAGRKLIAESIENNVALKFTRGAVGSKVSQSNDLENVTELENYIMDIPVTKAEEENTQESIKLVAVLDNKDVKTLFELWELGIFAKLENSDEEILYLYGCAEQGDTILPFSVTPHKQRRYIDTLISNTSDITIITDDTKVYATNEQLNSLKEDVKSNSDNIEKNKKDIVEIAAEMEDVQKKKITTDTGGATVFVSDTSKDVLAEIVAKGAGMNTIYGIGGSVNSLPSGLSWRGISFFNAPQFGFVLANDYKGGFHNNYYNNTAGWTGWKKLSTLEEVTLWSGIERAVGREIKLSESIDNYDRIKIWGKFYNAPDEEELKYEGMTSSSSYTIKSGGLNDDLSTNFIDSAEVALKKVNGTSLQIVRNKYVNVSGTSTLVGQIMDYSEEPESFMAITKIVGVRD